MVSAINLPVIKRSDADNSAGSSTLSFRSPEQLKTHATAEQGERTPMTDTGVFRILTESDLASLCGTASKSVQQQSVDDNLSKVDAEKRCPRCNFPIQTEQNICPDCRVLLESSRSIFRRIFSAAMRTVR